MIEYKNLEYQKNSSDSTSDELSKSWYKNGDFKLHILNEKNIRITKKFIESIFKKYNLTHKVKNLENFQIAMVHISYMNRSSITEKTARILKDTPPITDSALINVMPLQEKGYGRLEYKGDAIIHNILADYLFERYPNENEGFLTTLRTKLEKSETLSKLSKILGLHKYAVVARNIDYDDGRNTNTHLTEDLFESFFGALSLELDYNKCKDFLISIIEKELDMAEMIYIDDNYKNQLMQYFHKMKWSEPKYHEKMAQKDATNGSEKHMFSMCVKNPNGVILGVGTGNNKTKAEQDAAKNALLSLGVINDNAENLSDYYGELSECDTDSSDIFGELE